MTQGLFLMLATGFLWAGLAVVVAESSRRKLSICRVLPLSALLALAGVGFICLFQGVLKGGAFQIALQIVLLIGAGIGNYLMLKCVYAAMKIGNGGIIWGITQSSMIIPFMVGIIFFHEESALLRLTGVGIVMMALFLFAFSKSDKSADGNGWLFLAFTAFFLSGLAQSSASLPSYLQLEGMTSLRRMCLTQVGIILAAAVDMLIWQRAEFRFSCCEFIAAGAFGALNLGALCCFYYGLNLLANSGYASLGYPLGQGSSIAIFFLICKFFYQEKSSLCGLIAFIAMLSGILLLAIGVFL